MPGIRIYELILIEYRREMLLQARRGEASYSRKVVTHEKLAFLHNVLTENHPSKKHTNQTSFSNCKALQGS